MSVSADYLAYVTDQLSGLARVSTRRMFGAIGLYADDVIFGLIDDDVLYFKVDDATREDYLRRGSTPFRPYKDEPTYSMNYFAVPPDVLEDADELTRWARTAVQVARAAALKKKPKRTKRAKRRTA